MGATLNMNITKLLSVWTRKLFQQNYKPIRHCLWVRWNLKSPDAKIPLKSLDCVRIACNSEKKMEECTYPNPVIRIESTKCDCRAETRYRFRLGYRIKTQTFNISVSGVWFVDEANAIAQRARVSRAQVKMLRSSFLVFLVKSSLVYVCIYFSGEWKSADNIHSIRHSILSDMCDTERARARTRLRRQHQSNALWNKQGTHTNRCMTREVENGKNEKMKCQRAMRCIRSGRLKTRIKPFWKRWLEYRFYVCINLCNHYLHLKTLNGFSIPPRHDIKSFRLTHAQANTYGYVLLPIYFLSFSFSLFACFCIASTGKSMRFVFVFVFASLCRHYTRFDLVCLLLSKKLHHLEAQIHCAVDNAYITAMSWHVIKIYEQHTIM